MMCVVKFGLQLPYSRERTPAHIEQEAEWDPGPVYTF